MVVGSIESDSAHYSLPQPPTTTMPTTRTYEEKISLMISKLMKEASGLKVFVI